MAGEVMGVDKTARRGPTLNDALIAEIGYIARLGHITKRDKPDFPALAREMNMSGEGLTGVTKQGREPSPDTLIRLAEFARRYEPQYSILRLFVAAGWLEKEDVDNYVGAGGDTQRLEDVTTAATDAGLSPKQQLAAYDMLRSLAQSLGLPVLPERAPDSERSTHEGRPSPSMESPESPS